jgi:hypothetical protein
VTEAIALRSGNPQLQSVVQRLGLGGMSLQSLVVVDLTNRAVAALDAAALCPYLKASGTLASLKLGYNHLGDSGACAVADALDGQVCHTLFFIRGTERLKRR